MGQPRAKRSPLILLAASTFLFWAALYIYFPILPLYAEAQGASLSMVGAVVASYAIAQLLLRIPLGVWADFLGRRKPFVAAGLVFASVGALAMAVAPNPWYLFAGRTITGVAATTWVIYSVLFAAYFPSNQTARGIGIITSVGGLAVVIATFVGGQLADLWGADIVFFIGAILGVLGMLSLIPVDEPVIRRTGDFTYGAFLKVATDPVVLMASLMGVLVHFASSATVFSITLVYAARIGASSADLGVVSAITVGSATLAALAAVYTIERWGYSHTIMLGAALMAITLMVTPLVTDLRLLEGLQIATGAGRGLAITALMALSISAATPGQRATAMGVYQALYAIGMLAGPIVGGLAAEMLGMASVFHISAAALLLTGWLAFLQKSHRR